jgi:hypothetical protein
MMAMIVMTKTKATMMSFSRQTEVANLYRLWMPPLRDVGHRLSTTTLSLHTTLKTKANVSSANFF